jgi:fructose-bisphosphate aldolase class I
MNAQNLVDIARKLVADNEGLLAMSESNPTCNQLFAILGILPTTCRSKYTTAMEHA